MTPIATTTQLGSLKQEVATLAADLRKATDAQFSRSLMIGRIKTIEALIPDDVTEPTVKPGRDEAAMKPDREDMVKALYAGRHSTWSTMPEDLKERWRKHADLILDELPGKTIAQVRAEALRDAQQVIAGEDSIAWARTASGSSIMLDHAIGMIDDLIADEEAGK